MIVLCGGALAQPSGNYGGAAWKVNEARCLIWNGQPYLPLGWRFSATAANIDAVSASGCKDAVLEMPDSDWNVLISHADAKGLRYLIARDVQAPTAPGWIVRPESFRLDGISKKGTYTMDVGTAGSVYYIVATEQGQGISKKGWAPISNGQISIAVDQAFPSDRRSILIFPNYANTSHSDYWERFDSARDELLKRLSQTRFGPGLRGFVNPLGRVREWTWPSGGFVPDSALFRIEFQNYLETKYRDVDALNRSWRLRSFELRDFARAARLVPLFSNNRGVESLLDPIEENLLAVDARTSAYWSDLRDAIDLSAARRTERLATAIRNIADVPVVYEWAGWSPIFDTQNPSGDGVGVRWTDEGTSGLENAARAASSTFAWRNKGWMVATEISNGSKPFGDARAAQIAASSCADLGAKGWFLRLSSNAELPFLEAAAADTSLNSRLAAAVPSFVFYPENARFPADTMQLPGGTWWLPTPSAGNRIDIGEGYEGYRHDAVYNKFIAIWRTSAPIKTKLRYLDPSQISIVNADGTVPEMKVSKDGIELVIGTTPMIITGSENLPVPTDALEDAQAKYKAYSARAKAAGINISDMQFMFEDSARRIAASPGQAFASMIENLRKIEKAIGRFSWIEGERPEESNFSFTGSSAATSNGKYLAVDTPYMTLDGNFFVSYSFKAAPGTGASEVWIAARIPKEVRPFVQVEMRDREPMKLGDNPVSTYGDGFSWYRLGDVNLKPGSYRVTVRLLAGAPRYEAALDVILITPQGFRPSGLRLPKVD